MLKEPGRAQDAYQEAERDVVRCNGEKVHQVQHLYRLSFKKRQDLPASCSDPKP